MRKLHVNVGDTIQIEINGAFVLERPVVITAIRRYQGTHWVFVQGSNAAVPICQAVLINHGSTDNDHGIAKTLEITHQDE